MTKGRLEAFSDGVFAIIITITVLDLRVPHSASFAALGALLPVFLSYVMSFLYVGWKGLTSLFMYSLALAIAFVRPMRLSAVCPKR